MSESASAAQSTRSCSSPNASSAPVREARLQRSRYSAISASRSAFSSQKMSSWRAMRSAKRLRRNIRSPSGSPGGVILDVAGNFPKPPFGGPVAAACCVSYLAKGGGRRRIPSAVADEPALVRGLGRLPEPHLGPRPRNVAGRGLGHLRAAGRGRSVVLLHPLGLRAGLGRPAGRLVAGLAGLVIAVWVAPLNGGGGGVLTNLLPMTLLQVWSADPYTYYAGNSVS